MRLRLPRGGDGLLERMLAPDNVNAAWRALRRDTAPWAPGIGAEVVRTDAPYFLLELVREIERGRYRPLPVRQYAVRKADRGRRVLSRFYLRDKLAQRMALQVLQPLGEARFHHDSFGYRPNRGVAQALARSRERVATGLAWLVDADIERFFDCVPHGPLRRRLRGLVPDARVRALLEAWLAVGPHPGCLLGRRRGLLQGAILSPFLCNVHLDAFDRALAARNIPFVRYADDFLLFAPDREAAQAAAECAGVLLRRLGLRLHPRKTRVRHASEVRFLGEPLVRRRRRRLARREGR